MQEMEQLASVQGLPTDRNTLNKLMALHPAGLNSHMNNNAHMVNRGALSGSAQAALALTNYQNLLRQNSMNSSNPQQEGPSSFNSSNQSPSSTFQGPATLIPGSMQNLPGGIGGFSSPHLLPQQQQRSLNPSSLLQQNPGLPSQSSQALQQQMLQQMLQEINNCGSGMQQQSLSGQNNNNNVNGSGSMTRGGMGFGNNGAAASSTVASPNLSGSVGGPSLSKSNSFKGPLNSDSSAGGAAAAAAAAANSGFNNQKASDLQHNLHLSEEMVQDIAREFTDNGFFNSDLEDNLSYDWKA